MPFLQAARRHPSRSALLDDKAKKCGRRATVFSVTGDEYTGEWLNNKKHGRGIQLWKKSGSIYNGEWKMGKRDGFGTYSVLVPDTKTYAKKYCGEWKNGMKHGHGTFLYHRCSLYEGQWSEDQRSGWGRMLFNGGDTYEGDWTKDKEHGLGIRRYVVPLHTTGRERERRRTARGTRTTLGEASRKAYSSSPEQIKSLHMIPYEKSDFNLDQLESQAPACVALGRFHCTSKGERRYTFQTWTLRRLSQANGNWYEGSWRDGEKNGKGKLYYCDRGHLYEGLWVRGEPKCGTLEDFGGDHATQPAKCPIPQVKLTDMEMVLQEAHLAHLNC
ncbi:MORN repeat-containing protein 3 [Phyllopteryx taeniolatus]|uniref:MORN repeat-containing protein 3 n=1 Tax=Phyllopteryx taeniolatus TaxID=161469 RepID=UPI002AD54116|nr:MORN repeat-containing protein 3 [Phyllopteryx taeniolatus]